MRAYVATTGTVFALVTVAHLARSAEISHRTDDPWFVGGYTALTILSASLAVWAWRIYRSLPHRGSTESRP